MEGELRAASDKYVYLQKTRAYVQDLCYMLQVGGRVVAGWVLGIAWRVRVSCLWRALFVHAAGGRGML